MLRRFVNWLLGRQEYRVEVYLNVPEIVVRINKSDKEPIHGSESESTYQGPIPHNSTRATTDEQALENISERLSTVKPKTPEVKFGEET
jgi:hypothetical protein